MLSEISLTEASQILGGLALLAAGAFALGRYRRAAVEAPKPIAADDLRQLNQRLLQAIECINQAFGLFDAEERLVMCNQRYREIYRRNGTDPTSATAEVGMSLRDLLRLRIENGLNVVPPGQSVASYIEERRRGIRGAAHHVWQTADGRWFDIDLRPTPDGGMVTLWNDITQLKRSEEKRQQLERQLNQAHKLEALGTLAGGIAHDLNNTLVPILSLAKITARKLPEESRERNNLSLIFQASERARDLVRRILAFSRNEAPARGIVDFAKLLRESLEMLCASIPSSIQFQERIEAVPPILADAGQLHQVIINCIINAAQAIGDKTGTITIALSTAPAEESVGGGSTPVISFSVRDTGCGIEAALLDRVFEPFFTTKRVGEGTGLGLSMAHGIVAEHGGRMTVESQVGRGSCFTIYLPTLSDEDVARFRAKEMAA